MSAADDVFLLTIRGALRATTLAEAREAHNMTAGNPDGVAAARDRSSRRSPSSSTNARGRSGAEQCRDARSALPPISRSEETP